MTLMIKSWPSPGTCGAPATGSPCDPCKPPPQEGGGPGTGLPFFTSAGVFITQFQYYKSSTGQISRVVIGYISIPMAGPITGSFGTPSTLGPISYGFVSTWVVYKSQLDIAAPLYTEPSYSLPDITTTTLGYATGNAVTDAVNAAAFASANTSAGNAAIAQANAVLSNP